MGYKLIVREDLWRHLRAHLLTDSSEHLAFLLARSAGDTLLVRDLITVPDDALENGNEWEGLSLQLPVLLDIMNTANREQLVLVEAHSHPLSQRKVGFSPIDLQGQKELVAHLADVSPGRLYGALVFGQKAVRGQVWRPGRKTPAPLEIRVAGQVLERWPGSGVSAKQTTTKEGESDTYSRQTLALGPEGQENLRRTRVAVVGVGGLGSIVAQELAHLGVGGFLIVDDDVVEASNLHRLVGASRASIGRPKGEVAKDLIAQINPGARVDIVCNNVRSSEALAAVKRVDLIFGCLDTDAGRLILNELALAYLVPYIDCGVGITVANGRITEAGGRVVVWVPGRPCLLCCREISPRIAAEELESAEEREFRRRHGYVAGANVPEPAVISLNGTVASLAVTELLALLTGFRMSHHYTYYDMLEQRVGPRIVDRDRNCTACSLEGLGDLASLERYSRAAMSEDLPRL